MLVCVEWMDERRWTGKGKRVEIWRMVLTNLPLLSFHNNKLSRED